MTGRVRVFACLLTLTIVAATLLAAIPVAAPPPIPMRTQGQALDRTGTALPVATPIRAFVDGAVVLGLFLLFGFLRARKKPAPPAAPPSSPPLAPTILPPVGAATVTPGIAPDKKACPRCHTHVNVIDVTCFFCGYKFPEEAKPPP